MTYHGSHEMDQAKDVILKAAHSTRAFAKELTALQAHKVVPEDSPLQKLSPSLEDGLACVGGLLKNIPTLHLQNAKNVPLSKLESYPH